MRIVRRGIFPPGTPRALYRSRPISTGSRVTTTPAGPRRFSPNRAVRIPPIKPMAQAAEVPDLPTPGPRRTAGRVVLDPGFLTPPSCHNPLQDAPPKGHPLPRGWLSFFSLPGVFVDAKRSAGLIVIVVPPVERSAARRFATDRSPP